MTPMIQVTGLTKSFGPHRVLDRLSMSVPEGAVLAVLGPNGAGKTTLVRSSPPSSRQTRAPPP